MSIYTVVYMYSIFTVIFAISLPIYKRVMAWLSLKFILTRTLSCSFHRALDCCTIVLGVWGQVWRCQMNCRLDATLLIEQVLI